MARPVLVPDPIGSSTTNVRSTSRAGWHITPIVRGAIFGPWSRTSANIQVRSYSTKYLAWYSPTVGTHTTWVLDSHSDSRETIREADPSNFPLTTSLASLKSFDTFLAPDAEVEARPDGFAGRRESETLVSTTIGSRPSVASLRRDNGQFEGPSSSSSIRPESHHDLSQSSSAVSSLSDALLGAAFDSVQCTVWVQSCNIHAHQCCQAIQSPAMDSFTECTIGFRREQPFSKSPRVRR